jgi:hypothetical protein
MNRSKARYSKRLDVKRTPSVLIFFFQRIATEATDDISVCKFKDLWIGNMFGCININLVWNSGEIPA